MNLAQYRRELDPLVKPQEFRANWGVLGHLAVHFALITAVSIWVARNLSWLPWWAWLGLAVLMGHSIACTGFAAHELDHDVPVKSTFWNYVWETVGWAYSLTICTTIHRKAHILHHVFTNGPGEPNGRPTYEEMKQFPAAAKVSEWLFPNSKHPIASAFFGLWLVNLNYQMNLLFHTLGQKDTRFNMRLPRWRCWLSVAETFVFNVGLYAALWAASGFAWPMLAYLLVMNYVGTTIGLAYICTNHLLNPMMDGEMDPMALTLSVKVPKWADFCHLRFSYHVEHHLYPEAGPSNYPRIREALQARFPDRFHLMNFTEAYRQILQCPLVYLDAKTLVDVEGNGARTVVLASPADVSPAPALLPS